MKMRVRGVTVGGCHLGGQVGRGTAIGLNTECKILISHRNVLSTIL